MSLLTQDAACRLQPATLDAAALSAIRGLEEQLGDNIHLLAVKRQRLFVLEAKTAANQWDAVREVYPDADLTAYFCDKASAHLAKSALKSLLLGKWKNRFRKHPLRIREV